VWHRKIQRTRHGNRKTASIEFAYESKQTSHYSPRALVAVRCVQRLRRVQTTLPAEGLSARSDNSWYWWLRRRWRRNCESAEIATRDHHEPSHPGCGAPVGPLACRKRATRRDVPLPQRQDACATIAVALGLDCRLRLGLRLANLRRFRFFFAPGEEPLDHVKGYRDKEDRDRRCGDHSANHSRAEDAPGNGA
jgi:hypothetical protein